MKRIIIICEGQTEQQFCNDVLQPYFINKGINIFFPIVKKTGGGIVNWQALKHQVELHLKQDKDAFVTTLIDFYGIHSHHKYPHWETVSKSKIKNDNIIFLEDGMKKTIEVSLQNRFFPYVQLHEFEALLFSDLEVYKNSFENHEFLDYTYLVETIKKNENPEEINDGVETAPSKRLSKIIKGYFSDNGNMKVYYGSLIAHDIGLVKIREKCPRFNLWIVMLETL